MSTTTQNFVDEDDHKTNISDIEYPKQSFTSLNNPNVPKVASSSSSSSDYKNQTVNLNFSDRTEELHPREFYQFVTNNIMNLGYPSSATVDQQIQLRSNIEKQLESSCFYSKGHKSIQSINNEHYKGEIYKPFTLKNNEISRESNAIEFQESTEETDKQEKVYIVPLSLNIDSLRQFLLSRCVPSVIVMFEGYHFMMHSLPRQGTLEYNPLDSPLLEPGCIYVNQQDNDAVKHEARRVSIDNQNHHEDYMVKMVDWIVPLDFTPYIGSMCRILNEKKLEDFVANQSTEKKLSVSKDLDFSFEKLETYAVSHAKNLGYMGKVATSVVFTNASPRVITLKAAEATKSSVWSNVKNWFSGPLDTRVSYEVNHKPKDILLSVAHKFPWYGEGQAPSTTEIVKSLQDLPDY